MGFNKHSMWARRDNLATSLSTPIALSFITLLSLSGSSLMSGSQDIKLLVSAIATESPSLTLLLCPWCPLNPPGVESCR